MNAIAPPQAEPNRKRLMTRITIFSVCVGPLIGDAPFLWWSIYSIPAAYLIGAVPALLGSGLYGLIVASHGTSNHYNLLQRMLLGAGCGAAGCLVFGLALMGSVNALFLVPFGTGAGAVCALLYKRAWMERDLFPPLETRAEIIGDTGSVERGDAR